MQFQPEFYAYALGDRSFGGACVFVERFDKAQIDTDADFELKRLACFMTRDAAPQTEADRQIPTGVLFNIRDNATGRTIFAGFADTGEIFGDGKVPFVLPTSHFFKRGSQAQVLYAPIAQQGPDFDNGSLWLVMIGCKHFGRSQR